MGGKRLSSKNGMGPRKGDSFKGQLADNQVKPNPDVKESMPLGTRRLKYMGLLSSTLSWITCQSLIAMNREEILFYAVNDSSFH